MRACACVIVCVESSTDEHDMTLQSQDHVRHPTAGSGGSGPRFRNRQATDSHMACARRLRATSSCLAMWVGVKRCASARKLEEVRRRRPSIPCPRTLSEPR